MKKFTSLFAVAALAVLFPACSKKAKKTEVKAEQVQTEQVSEIKNNKEEYSA